MRETTLRMASPPVPVAVPSLGAPVAAAKVRPSFPRASGASSEKPGGEQRPPGHHAAPGQFTDMLEAGIIDPTKVTRTALQNAGSISGFMITTECLATGMPEDEKRGMPAPALELTSGTGRTQCPAADAGQSRRPHARENGSLATCRDVFGMPVMEGGPPWDA